MIELGGVNITVAEECLYAVDSIYFTGLAQWFSSFNGLYELRPPGMGIFSSRVFRNIFYNERFWMLPPYNKGNSSFQTIDVNMENLATAITSQMRPNGLVLVDVNSTISNLAAKKSVVKGKSTQAAVCTKFDRAWLLFYALLLVFSTAFLVAVILRQQSQTGEHYKAPIWKTSVLPLLFSGPDHQELSRRGGF